MYDLLTGRFFCLADAYLLNKPMNAVQQFSQERKNWDINSQYALRAFVHLTRTSQPILGELIESYVIIKIQLSLRRVNTGRTRYSFAHKIACISPTTVRAIIQIE